MRKKKSEEELHAPHDTAAINEKLNWLRAAVLGANDGIVSIAGLVVGIAGATTNRGTILTAGVAGVIAGALSMAAGEYVSVSSQKDTEESLIEQEKYELKHHPKRELEELAQVYELKGLSPKTAKVVAEELTAHDPIRAHLDAEFNMNPDETSNPSHAALASAIAFTAGAVIPFAAVMVPSTSLRVPLTFAAVLLALFITGFLSAKVSESRWVRPTLRVVFGGILAMLVTYGIGNLFNVHV